MIFFSSGQNTENNNLYLNPQDYLQATKCAKSYEWENVSENQEYPQKFQCKFCGCIAYKLKNEPVMYLLTESNEYKLLNLTQDEYIVKDIIQ